MLNIQQQYILDEALQWWKSSEQTFQITGNPGCGKSYLLFHILDSIGVDLDRVACMAYTGQAAIIMRINGMTNARTIYSWLYDPIIEYVTDDKGNYVLDPYYHKPIEKLVFVPKDLSEIDLFVIDEASMVPMEMKKEIESRGKKIIATGDLDQLPPVIGEPAFLKDGTIYRLTEIMRQKRDSPIIYLSRLALEGKRIETGTYGNCKVIYEDELTDYEIVNSDIIICGKNATRDMINTNYRKNILRCQSELPSVGERMVCRKNNWNIGVDGINLANGLIGNVTRSPMVEGFDNDCYTIDFKPYMTSSAFTNLLSDYKYLIASNEQKKIIKNAKYSLGEKMEYAYAISTHMSQGGQFGNGIYVEEYLNKSIQKNLNYTGITRFKDSLIYVKKRPKNFYMY